MSPEHEDAEIEARKKRAERGWICSPPPVAEWIPESHLHKWRLMMGGGRG